MKRWTWRKRTSRTRSTVCATRSCSIKPRDRQDLWHISPSIHVTISRHGWTLMTLRTRRYWRLVMRLSWWSFPEQKRSTRRSSRMERRPVKRFKRWLQKERTQKRQPLRRQKNHTKLIRPNLRVRMKMRRITSTSTWSIKPEEEWWILDVVGDWLVQKPSRSTRRSWQRLEKPSQSFQIRSMSSDMEMEVEMRQLVESKCRYSSRVRGWQWDFMLYQGKYHFLFPRSSWRVLEQRLTWRIARWFSREPGWWLGCLSRRTTLTRSIFVIGEDMKKRLWRQKRWTSRLVTMCAW